MSAGGNEAISLLKCIIEMQRALKGMTGIGEALKNQFRNAEGAGMSAGALTRHRLFTRVRHGKPAHQPKGEYSNME